MWRWRGFWKTPERDEAGRVHCSATPPIPRGAWEPRPWQVCRRRQAHSLRQSPVIGYLGTSSAQSGVQIQTMFRQGLATHGFTEGHNFRMENQWAAGQYDRLPAMADESDAQAGVRDRRHANRFGACRQGRDRRDPDRLRRHRRPRRAGACREPCQAGRQFNRRALLSFPDWQASNFGLLHELVPRVTRMGVLDQSEQSKRPCRDQGGCIGRVVAFALRSRPCGPAIPAG